MDKHAAQKMIQDTLERSFDKGRFFYFLKNMLNHVEENSSTIYRGNHLPEAYKPSIDSLELLGKYNDEQDNEIDLLVVQLKKDTSLERARALQRNFASWHLKGGTGGNLKDAALTAYVSPSQKDWRFSFVKMDYKFVQLEKERVRVKEEFTPARRYSFLVGENENSHTAKSQLLPLLEDDEKKPTLGAIEDKFNIETVTKEFFERYRDLFLRTTESLDKIVESDPKIKEDFLEKNVNTLDFSKKLLGQIVFLYFLQKKGWFGVEKNNDWGTGSKSFIRDLFNQKSTTYTNFFNEILEPLFYEALASERTSDFYAYLNCKIPFLNGGLFDPIGNYDWVHTDILLPNDLFSNKKQTSQGDIGTGIFDIFDRYNFTVKEDEPLEKEVAVDPEMLGKVFENLLEVKDRKSKGAFYTPREIVHYMCQKSLAQHLQNQLNGKVKKDEIETLLRFGETVMESDPSRLSETIHQNARALDDALCRIRICDPAVGSGAFLVGIMNEIVRARNVLTSYIGENKDRSAYSFKRGAIHDCLYGVDIDPSAVEICKLRLWLSLVVDEDDVELIQPLPNLDYKIVAGNSLLSMEKDLFNDSLFKELEGLKPIYFEETNVKKKIKYKEKIDSIILQLTNKKNDFDYEVYFSEVYHINKGFDIVLANPPYVDSEEMTKSCPELRKFISSTFKTAKGNWDLYIPFYELGFNLLAEKGNAVFITPNKWLAIKYGEKLREFIRGSLSGIGNCDDINVFEAGNSPVVIFFKKNTKNQDFKVERFGNDFSIKHEMVASKSVKEFDNWGFFLSKHISILLKIAGNNKKLKDSFITENPFTVGEAYEFKKILKTLKSKSLFASKEYLKFVNTGTIDKYEFLWGRKQTTYLKDKYLFPVVSRRSFSSKFPKRFDQMNQPKIIISGMRHFECMLDSNGEVIAGKSTVIIRARDNINLHWILGILNSKLMTFYINESFGALGIDGGINFTAQMVGELPLPIMLKEKINKISKMVVEIMNLFNVKNASLVDSDKKRASLEHQIDNYVYKLYDLTPEEIKLVEQ